MKHLQGDTLANCMRPKLFLIIVWLFLLTLAVSLYVNPFCIDEQHRSIIQQTSRRECLDF